MMGKALAEGLFVAFIFTLLVGVVIGVLFWIGGGYLFQHLRIQWR